MYSILEFGNNKEEVMILDKILLKIILSIYCVYVAMNDLNNYYNMLLTVKRVFSGCEIYVIYFLILH